MRWPKAEADHGCMRAAAATEAAWRYGRWSSACSRISSSLRMSLVVTTPMKRPAASTIGRRSMSSACIGCIASRKASPADRPVGAHDLRYWGGVPLIFGNPAQIPHPGHASIHRARDYRHRSLPGSSRWSVKNSAMVISGSAVRMSVRSAAEIGSEKRCSRCPAREARW